MHWIVLDRQSGMSLVRQLYTVIRKAIAAGQLIEGEALPSTRELKASLGVSRNTAVEAYEMLAAEGWVETSPGSRTRIARGLTGSTASQCRSEHGHKPEQTLRSQHGLSLWQNSSVDFRTGIPDMAALPTHQWVQCITSAEKEMLPKWWGYTDAAGLEPLRREIAAYLFRARGMHVEFDSIFVTTGTTQSLHIVASILGKSSSESHSEGQSRIDRGAVPVAIVEDPSHIGLVRALRDHRYTLVPCAVDSDGLCVDRLPRPAPHSVRFVYTTPSHQYPLGGVLAAPRRLELIRYVQAIGCYIVEDDYDSEYRHSGRPVGSLWELHPDAVIYAGTFSKTLFPSLRLGYAVVPPHLHRAWRRVRTGVDVQNSALEQLALSIFLRERRLDKHVTKMKRCYARKRARLIDALTSAFGSHCSALGDAAGLHLVIQMPGVDMRAVARRAERSGVIVTPVERHAIVKGHHTDKLILGYGNLRDIEIDGGIEVIAKSVCGTDWGD